MARFAAPTKEFMKRIVIAGGSGFLGGLLTAHFQRLGWQVTVLTRSPGSVRDGMRQVQWDAVTVDGWALELEGADALINLAGRSVNCRYTKQNRRLIMESRIFATRVLGLAILKCKTPPPVWLNASTATIYRHTFGPAWDESGIIAATPEARDAFSVQVATAWERALAEAPAATPATRKIALRAAMVLGFDRNSVFPALRRLTRLGLGGRMGGGRQFVSWIHKADFCRAIQWLLDHGDLAGPVNICAPNPVTNEAMMKIFREAYGVPVGLPATEWMLELGAFVLRTESELILKSRRVVPRRLLNSGFVFQFPTLPGAVKNLQNQSETQNAK
jgi:uncharacterized protein (TIGR01777 family)